LTVSISAKKQAGIINLFFKNFSLAKSGQLFNFIITNDALKPFNSISINIFSIDLKLLMIDKD
jgi:hypothetical protein